MQVVIVESPAKAKTINKYLGKNYQVLASYGHVRDLPSKDGSVRPETDFAMAWDLDRRGRERMAEIADAVRKADGLILATDPDREGEAISWHVLEILKDRKVLDGLPVQRVVFNEITKSAIEKAMAEPRQIDREMVDAYLARRALDYLVGFTLSPVLWRKLPGARSAGRVQSVALRLVCDRELEIEKFRPREYWTVESDFRPDGAAPDAPPLRTRLVTLDGKKLERFSLADAGAAAAARKAIEEGTFSVGSVETRPGQRHPQPPFTTSTLQQEAARKLGFSASRTMQVAQRLYEGLDIRGETVGLITYMRTDSVAMAAESVAGCRALIDDRFGSRYLPAKPRVHRSRSKSAQEAHEAIRPTDPSRLPDTIATHLDRDQRALYELIWKRAVASQMASAETERTTVEVRSEDGRTGLRATGTVILFDGFLTLYQEGRDDNGEEEGEDRRLPKVEEGARLALAEARTDQHFTEPPPRFTEATLVKRLEELGIGRPSTYASILSVLRDRNYVRMDRNRFVPEDKGRLVTAFLESFFERYVEYDFTAQLEKELDDISAGKVGWKEVLRTFWENFSAAVEETKELRITDVLEALNELLGPHIFPETEPGKDPRACPSCGKGRLSLKIGRYGAFVGCSDYPDCRYTRPFVMDGETDRPEGGTQEPKALGIDPETGLEITLRSGRFGPYLQLGPDPDKTAGKKAEKPRRARLPRDIPAEALSLDRALALLALPREIGIHPESGKPIQAGIGPYGPYLLHEGRYTRLKESRDALEIGVNRAVTLIAEAKASGGRRGPAKLRDLGPHPEDGAPVELLDGRYGPYVRHQKTNASLPKGRGPEDVSLEEAMELLAARAARAGSRSGAKSAQKKKAATKKRSAAKTKAKRPATKKKAAKASNKTNATAKP